MLGRHGGLNANAVPTATPRLFVSYRVHHLSPHVTTYGGRLRE